jgi:hypothetical protein
MALKKRAESSRAGSVSRSYGSKDPDPRQNVTDPEHCFVVSRTLMSKKTPPETAFQQMSSMNVGASNYLSEMVFLILLRSPRVDSMESTRQPIKPWGR